MGIRTDDTNQTKLEKYLKAQGRGELIETLQGLTIDELRNRLKDQAIAEQQTLNLREVDKALKESNEKTKELNSTYNEQLRMNKKICRYINELLQDKGGI